VSVVQELPAARVPVIAKPAEERTARGARGLLSPGAVSRVGLTVLSLVVAALAAVPVSGQTLRIEDESGVVHYTNEPCAPLYRRLAPGACRPPAAAAETAPAAETEAAGSYAGEIERTASRYGVDGRLVEAMVRVESGGDPKAVSPKGARGLMQLMPGRAAALGVADAFDPRANLDGGVRHLHELLLRYAGNVTLALAAYNAGEEAVRLHGGVPPFPETQEYVRKVLALYTPADRASAAPPRRPPTRSRL
jgi:Transglycosylase SLT domain